MRKLSALVAVMAISLGLAREAPAMAHENESVPENIDSPDFYAAHDHGHVIENDGFELLVRSMPPSGGNKPTIYITLDDGSSFLSPKHFSLYEKFPEYRTTNFINCREQVPGTFQKFLDYPNRNTYGLHGCSHPDLRGLSRSQRISEMQRNAEYVNARIRTSLKFGCYRPGFGGTNDSVRADLASIGLVEYLWNHDPRDWESPGVNVILAELERMQDGDIIVLHDSNGKEQTLAALELFLERHASEYVFDTLPGCPSGKPPCKTGAFEDVCVEDMFFSDIEWLGASGITKGCNPPDNTLFCPDDPVTRGQLAGFLVRALGLTAASNDWFSDDNGSTFEPAINQIAEAGITMGCNPPENDQFCPEGNVTRGQTAALFVRALGLSEGAGTDLFTDDNGSIFESAIDRLGTSGITKGCNPPDNDRFCPDDLVSRAQMAAFLKRALNKLQAGRLNPSRLSSNLCYHFSSC